MRPAAARLDQVAWNQPGQHLITQAVRGLWTIARSGQIIAAYTETVMDRKYTRTVFTGPAHAHRLAARLNHATGGTDYTVVRLCVDPT